MRAEIAEIVHKVLNYGLQLKERLERGETPDLRMEQSALKGLLLSDMEARRWGADFGGDASSSGGPARSMASMSDMNVRRGSEGFLGIRYALACWLDETFTRDENAWSNKWSESKMEGTLYGTNDRAFMFWEQAKKAEGRSGSDALEVYFLCVVLGFRGEKRREPAFVQEWLKQTQERIARSQGQQLPVPPELEPRTAVDPRYGRDRLQRMVLITAIFVLVALPVLVLLLMKKFFS